MAAAHRSIKAIVAILGLLCLASSCQAIRPNKVPLAGDSQQEPSPAAAAAAPTATQRSLLQAGIPVGTIVGAVQTGVNAGINLAAPIVNGIASNIPILVPSLNGHCIRGEPIMPFRNSDVVMCLVGDGAQVTNYLFNAASQLTGMAGSYFGRR